MSSAYGIDGAVGDLARAAQATGHQWGQVHGEWNDQQSERFESEYWLPMERASRDLVATIEALQSRVASILADLP